MDIVNGKNKVRHWPRHAVIRVFDIICCLFMEGRLVGSCRRYMAGLRACAEDKDRARPGGADLVEVGPKERCRKMEAAPLTSLSNQRLIVKDESKTCFLFWVLGTVACHSSPSPIRRSVSQTSALFDPDTRLHHNSLPWLRYSLQASQHLSYSISTSDQPCR